MRVVSSPGVADAVRERGGRLFVWPKSGRCCRGKIVWLETGTSPKAGLEFDRVPVQGFELHVARMGREPDELHLDVHGRRRRVAAYWDECAWVT